MSDMKCPFCQQELRIWGEACGVCDTCYMLAPVKLWQELITTRKALDILKEFITKLYLNGNITDEQLERYKNKVKSITKGGKNE